MPGLWWQYQFKCISKYCLILILLLALLLIPLLPVLEDVWNTLTMCMLSLHRQNSCLLCIYLVCTPGLTQIPLVKLTSSKMFAPSVVLTPSFCIWEQCTMLSAAPFPAVLWHMLLSSVTTLLLFKWKYLGKQALFPQYPTPHRSINYQMR